MRRRSLFEDRVFLAFLVVVSLAMAWVISPFYGAILWGVIAGIVFAPVNDRILLRNPTRRNSAAALTLLIVIAMVVIPTFFIGSLVIDELVKTYGQIQSREIDVARILADIQNGLPPWLDRALDRMGLGNLGALQARLSSFLSTGLRLAATRAVSVGQGAFSFALSVGIMLYLAFFLLRDGRQLTRTIGSAIPLQAERKAALFIKFTTVIRATIKGSIVVAIVQGLIGGFTFWLLGIHSAVLWGVVMALLSLVPAIGTGLIWVPVAIYLLATGSVTEGIILLLAGVFVISMVDNVLRPILVGKDTRMPDYVILITTLGGLSVFGIHGFVIGPVIAALFIAGWQIFAEDRHAALEAPGDA